MYAEGVVHVSDAERPAAGSGRAKTRVCGVVLTVVVYGCGARMHALLMHLGAEREIETENVRAGERERERVAVVHTSSSNFQSSESIGVRATCSPPHTYTVLLTQDMSWLDRATGTSAPPSICVHVASTDISTKVATACRFCPSIRW
jgi:hypothetical protein